MVFWLDSLFAFWYQKSVTSQAAGGLFLLYLVLAFYYTLFCQLHFLIELLEITCESQVTASCQTNTFPKHIYVSQAYISNVTNNNKKRTLKNRQVNKFSKTTIVQNPVQSPFLLFIPYFHVLIGYFHGSLRLVAAPIVRILINFVTQLL